LIVSIISCSSHNIFNLTFLLTFEVSRSFIKTKLIAYFEFPSFDVLEAFANSFFPFVFFRHYPPQIHQFIFLEEAYFFRPFATVGPQAKKERREIERVGGTRVSQLGSIAQAGL